MIVPLKGKKDLNIANAFQSILKTSNRKHNKIWVDKGSEFYNSKFKKWLKDNNIEMYSTHNKGKSVVAERFIRTIKNKIYKSMTSISKNVYIDKLDDIADEYNNKYYRTTKMKPKMKTKMLKIKHIIILITKLMIMILNLKLVIM